MQTDGYKHIWHDYRDGKADLAGPIGVAQLAGQVASAGFVNLLMLQRFSALTWES